MSKVNQSVIDNAAQKLLNKSKTVNTEEKKYNFNFDELQMYYGIDYKVDEFITIKQPSVGDIIRFGEQKLLTSISPFVTNPTTYRLFLWDLKPRIDWNKISDYELFVLLIQGLKKEDSELIFGDIDFSELFPIKDDDGNIILTNEFGNIQIDEEKYMLMREYIRLMFNQYPKVEKAKGKITKQAMIDEDRMNLINDQKNNKKHRSMYLPLVSSMVNHPGFKYKKSELDEVGIVEFMDSVKRLQVYESTTALMSGIYSGFCDTSKMDLKKELNWLRDLND